MNNFIAEKLALEGALIIVPTVYEDQRGYFLEWYNEKHFREMGINYRFVQDNHAQSNKGVLRGLHYQYPNSQARLVKVIKGSIYGVIVDVRVDSSTYLKWLGVELNSADKKMLLIPEGFAHGYLVLEDNTEIIYKVSNFYSEVDVKGIRYDDSLLNIVWPKLDTDIILSEKDRALTYLNLVGRKD